MALEYLTWWLISPGVACFLLLNVLVAAIAFTSRSRAQQGEGCRAPSTTRRRLCRGASSMVLDRLRSFAKQPSAEFCYYFESPEAEERQVSRAAASPDRRLAVPEPATMAAAISMSGNARDETAADVKVVAKSMVSSDGNVTCALVQEVRHAPESVLSSPPPAAAPATVSVVTAETARVAAALVRGPTKNKEEPATVAEFVKRKHRRRDEVYAVEGKAELNARAEQFIRQFRQELQLQRLDSMLGRHTHTLSTGSGAPTSR